MNKVLIVEDTEPLSDLIREILDQSGYEVVGQAYNGSESISMFMEKKPDLVLMDIMLPDMSGIDACKMILDIDNNTRIIVITALSRKEIKEDCLDVGCRAILTKPFRLKELVNIVNEVMNRSES